MKLPSSRELLALKNLVPVAELVDRLTEAVSAVDQHSRQAVVTLTYKVTFDHETETIAVHAAVKSKRPVKINRKEEIQGEPEQVFLITRDEPGQQRFTDS